MIYQAYLENKYTNTKFWIPYSGETEELVRIKIAAAGENLDKYKIVQVEAIQKKREPNSLTFREGQILIYLVDGLDNKEIATTLCISDKTIKNHISSIYRKFNVTNRTALVSKILRKKICELENEIDNINKLNILQSEK